MNILTYWNSGNVHRWHNNPSHAIRNSNDTTWAHSARVYALWYWLSPETADPAAVFDDCPEAVTGDMPSPTKALYGDLMHEVEHEWHEQHGTPTSASPWLKFCDRLDAYLWARSIDPSAVRSVEWQRAKVWLIEEARKLGCFDEIAGVV